MSAENVSVTGLMLIGNSTPNNNGHLTLARFDAAFPPGIELRGCTLVLSGTSNKPFWSASSPRRFSSARVADNRLYHAILDAVVAAYTALGGRGLTPAKTTTSPDSGMPDAITRMCGNSATGAWGEEQ